MKNTKLFRYAKSIYSYYRPKVEKGKSLMSGSYGGWHFWLGPIHLYRAKTWNNKDNFEFKCLWQPYRPKWKNTF